MQKTRAYMCIAMGVMYFAFGCLHVATSKSFLPIMPPWIPYPREVIIFTGICEILGGQGLLLRPVRKLSGIMLALYAVCVFPANIYHALAHVHVPPLPDSWWYHGPRMLAQPVLVWWALFASGVIDWPFASRAAAPGPTRRPDEPGAPA